MKLLAALATTTARMFSDKEEISIEEPEMEEPKVEVQAEPEPETTETQ